MTRLFVVGNVNVDLIMGPQLPWPAVGTEVVLPHMDLRAGGAAGNAALALHALGASFQLIAATGNDSLGQWLRGALEHLPGRMEILESPTAISVGITHPDGERSFFSHLGHLETHGYEHVLSALDSARPGDLLLLLGGFLMPALRARYPSLLEEAGQRQLRVALDPGWPAAGWEACRDEINAWLPHCQHLLINETEALHWSNSGDVNTAASKLRQFMPDRAVVVVKRGAMGASWYDGERFQHASAPSVQVIDTIGAGDSFDAAYLHCLARGGGLETAVRAGIATASLAVSSFPRLYTLPSAQSGAALEPRL